MCLGVEMDVYSLFFFDFLDWCLFFIFLLKNKIGFFFEIFFKIVDFLFSNFPYLSTFLSSYISPYLFFLQEK